MDLSAYLQDRKLNQAAFASLVGVSEAAVCRWVSGKSRPSWEKLSQIERVTDGKVTARDFVPAEALA